MDSLILLKQFTTEYIEQEDRIRLTSGTADGLLSIWLTQRLLQRLVPVLLQWLERQQITTPRAVTLCNVMQQTVQAADKTPRPLLAWLAHAVDITTANTVISLTFKDGEGQAAGIHFEAHQLRQWLEIVYEAYLQAQWPLEAWPTWVRENASVFNRPQAALWH